MTAANLTPQQRWLDGGAGDCDIGGCARCEAEVWPGVGEFVDGELWCGRCAERHAAEIAADALAALEDVRLLALAADAVVTRAVA